ncbi:centrosomal protein of 72 kDa isoform X3 [Erinaceus europaeus]|uniref:Centrosomal protein of 72 kDa isoform X3 n=1 Tax=Erinaceus europaeus TaxID=9365 RepID=A0ABM3XE16_ERIEU|nr:centrosomal protein of 72 kDa isoform X3 [Erinaceus europaeus]
MAPAGPLVLTEEAIREKSGVGPLRGLAELRSLSIPGTYQEKFTHLGDSLRHLTGLKSLDLSRNSLGIEYLVGLESLNLYHNCIPTLAEALRLRCLPCLHALDLRLNPVARPTGHYRLFMVHALPALRRLDDRPVRESERKASQLHFASEESLGSTQSLLATERGRRPPLCRASCPEPPEPSARQGLVLDADDEAVLTLIAECQWDLSSPPRSQGSSQECGAALASAPVCRPLLSPHALPLQCGDSAWTSQDRLDGGPWACTMDRELQSPFCGEPVAHPCPGHPEPTDVEDSAVSSQKSSLSSQKVSAPLPGPDRRRKQRLPGGRFQVLSEQECSSCSEGPEGASSHEPSLSRHSGSGSRSEKTCAHSDMLGSERPWPPSTSAASEPRPTVSPRPGRKEAPGTELPEMLLGLLDGHWGDDEAFQAQAQHVLSSLREPAASEDQSSVLTEKLNYLTLENKSLQSLLAEQQQRHREEMGQVQAELSNTRKELEDLRRRLDRALGDNDSLKSLLSSLKEARSSDAAALQPQIAGLQSSVKRLTEEVVELRQHLGQYDKVQELVHMLQDSHSSLVGTNERVCEAAIPQLPGGPRGGMQVCEAAVPQLPDRHQRAAAAGTGSRAGTTPGRDGAAALELPAAQEDPGPGPARLPLMPPQGEEDGAAVLSTGEVAPSSPVLVGELSVQRALLPPSGPRGCMAAGTG